MGLDVWYAGSTSEPDRRWLGSPTESMKAVLKNVGKAHKKNIMKAFHQASSGSLTGSHTSQRSPAHRSPPESSSPRTAGGG